MTPELRKKLEQLVSDVKSAAYDHKSDEVQSIRDANLINFVQDLIVHLNTRIVDLEIINEALLEGQPDERKTWVLTGVFSIDALSDGTFSAFTDKINAALKSGLRVAHEQTGMTSVDDAPMVFYIIRFERLT